MAATFKGSALTEDERCAFESLRDLMYSAVQYPDDDPEDTIRPCIMRGFLDGNEVAIVCIVTPNTDNGEVEYCIEPVAALLNEALLGRIGNADAEPLPGRASAAEH